MATDSYRCISVWYYLEHVRIRVFEQRIVYSLVDIFNVIVRPSTINSRLSRNSSQNPPTYEADTSNNLLLAVRKGVRKHRVRHASLKYRVNNHAMGVERRKETYRVIFTFTGSKGTASLTIRSMIIIEGLWRDSNRWMSSIVTSVGPAPSRLPISSLSFIGFRYLFFFWELELGLG